MVRLDSAGAEEDVHDFVTEGLHRFVTEGLHRPPGRGAAGEGGVGVGEGNEGDVHGGLLGEDADLQIVL
jgi:hypothetical protein